MSLRRPVVNGKSIGRDKREQWTCPFEPAPVDSAHLTQVKWLLSVGC